jgi:large subunit ribosomal protein L24e
MVIKTDLCAFSEYRIYPGNGMLFIRRDGKPVTLGSSKARGLLRQRKKPAKIVWTQAWRRQNKKGLSENSFKKRIRRTAKVQRAVMGASLDDIKKKAGQKTEFRSAQREAALKEIKERNKAAKVEKAKTAKSSHAKTQQKAVKQHAGKNQRGGQVR